MKKIIRYATILLALLYGKRAQVYAQDKPAIDTNVFGKWPSIGQASISADGRYSLYMVTYRNKTALYVTANTNKRKTVIANVRNAGFSNDSKAAYFINANDSLGTLTTKNQSVTYLPGIISFKIAKNGNWIAWLSKAHSKTLVVRNLLTGKTVSYADVNSYTFNKIGNVLLIRSIAGLSQSLSWLDLTTIKINTIWTGAAADYLTFNNKGDGLAFIATEEKEGHSAYVINYYIPGMGTAEPIAADTSADLKGGFSITKDQLIFSRNGDKIIFRLNKQATPEMNPQRDHADVDVWNYKDEYTQFDQLFVEPRFHYAKFIAVVNTATKKIRRLNGEVERINVPPAFENYVLSCEEPDYKIYYKYIASDYNLVNVNDGTKQFISDTDISYGLSPDGHFLVWFDVPSHQWFSLETSSGVKQNISKWIAQPLDDTLSLSRNISPRNYDICGWQPVTRSVFIYDKYDIWKIDLLGKNVPINITNGFGRKNNIVFTIASYNGLNNNQLRTIQPKEEMHLLLEGFDLENKYNGFWLANALSSKAPVMMDVGPYWYGGRTDGGDDPSNPLFLLKAAHTNHYIVGRQSARAFPNLYETSDFKHFNPVTELHPEKDYNWLTSELVTWKMTDGDTSQGVLYKPENFDPHKKYPVIFDYYVKFSNLLYSYETPDWTDARINIPYFVSNGYLVFMPDIHYKAGRNGQSIVNSLVSAARYLAQLPYVDSTKMGLQGHSFGGWETNYLVTHSHCFAAACSAAGVSDQISNYYETALIGALFPSNYIEQSNPGDPYGFGNTPSTRPELYEANSPVLSVEHATTPLLLIAGNLDPGVPFRQGLEMYLAMNRAGKKVWLLQYEKDGHILSGNDAKDYTIRLKQFFDYYLKDAPPPRWMVEGIPAKLKGIDTGYELEPGKAP